MSQLSIVQPTIGLPDSTQDPLIVNAFAAIAAWANGNIDVTNLSQAAATQLGGNTALQNAKGVFARSATDGTSSTSFVALGTPDQATVTLPTNGLISLAYQAVWNVSANHTATAAIFLNGVQLQLAAGGGPTAAQAAIMSASVAGGQDTPLGSTPLGLQGIPSSGATYPGDATTGQLIGVQSSAVGWCGPIKASAGNYTVQVRFMVDNGVAILNVHNRTLWVKAEAFQ